jgi:hypothetical protein
MSHLRMHTPTNIYGVPWLHLDKLQIVSWNFWAIIAFLLLWYLIICYNLWTSSTKFLFTIILFFCHMPYDFEVWSFQQGIYYFQMTTILDRNSVKLVFYINICHYKVLIFLNWGVGLKVLLVVSPLCIILFICSCILVVAC